MLATMVAEPLAGLADTAFVARLGAAPLAAVGVGAGLLSSVLWVFNFLGVGTQTEVAQADGAADARRVAGVTRLSLWLSGGLGVALIACGLPGLGPAVGWMSGDAEVRVLAERYLAIRLVGAPFALGMLAAFGALRGLQDMRSPLLVVAGMSALNVGLDWLLIFGWGPIPALGVAGAAWATTASQAVAAAAAVALVARRLGLTGPVEWGRARALLVVGRDMVLRTGALLLFLLLATRAALQVGVEAGAAHQAARQVWMTLAFVLDAWAITAQSLVGYFLGANDRALARRVARVSCLWGLATGTALGVAMVLSERPVEWLLVPEEARAAFPVVWWICAGAQPLNALSFVTDGIHWGTGDFAYLRNAMLLASGISIAALMLIDPARDSALAWIWLATGLWIAIRTGFGLARIWPSASGPLGR